MHAHHDDLSNNNNAQRLEDTKTWCNCSLSSRFRCIHRLVGFVRLSIVYFGLAVGFLDGSQRGIYRVFHLQRTTITPINRKQHKKSTRRQKHTHTNSRELVVV